MDEDDVFPVFDQEGCKREIFLAEKVGEQQLAKDYQVVIDRRYGAHNLYVVCKPELRKGGCWNVTEFRFDDNGNLVPIDNDVELDPYHMCLLYQLPLVNEWKEKKDEE